MAFVSGLKKVIVDLKIYYKLNFIYPSSRKFKRIKSITKFTDAQVDDYVVIEDNVDIGPFLNKLEKGLYIGKRSYIGYCNKIGKYTSISYDAKIGLVAHPLHFVSTSPVLYSKRRGFVADNFYDETQNRFTEIGNDVLISANVTILAGVKIGNGAVIGAGSFVNKDVPAYAIVAGTPARIIRYRFSEKEIEELENIQWWNFTNEKLISLQGYFNNLSQFISYAKS